MSLANDSIVITPGTGETVATQLISSKKYQVVIPAMADGTLMNAARTYVTLVADGVTPAASETVLTFSKNVGGTATSGQTTYAITAGKTLRIQAVTATLMQSSSTIVACKLRLRHNTAGAAVATSALVASWQLCPGIATAVANSGLVPQDMSFPDGLEIKQNGSDNITLSAIATSAAGTLTVTLFGYEY